MENLSKYINTWGHYNWGENIGYEYIHPEDIEKTLELSPFGLVLKCIAVEGEYMVLKHADKRIRVKPDDIYSIVPTPLFDFGDIVKKVNSNDYTGVIIGMKWHFNRRKVIYMLKVNGKIKSKIYFDEDLELVEKGK